MNMHVSHTYSIFRQSLQPVETSESFDQNLVSFAEVFVNFYSYFDLAVSIDLSVREVLLSATLDTQVHRILYSGATTALKLSRADMK